MMLGSQPSVPDYISALAAVINEYLNMPLQKIALKSSQSTLWSRERSATPVENQLQETLRMYFKQLAWSSTRHSQDRRCATVSIGKSKGSLSGPLFASFYHVCFTRCTIYATVALSSSLTEIFTSPLHTIDLKQLVIFSLVRSYLKSLTNSFMFNSFLVKPIEKLNFSGFAY